MTAYHVRWKIVLVFAAIYLIWGSTYLAIRYAVQTLPPLVMMGTRHLIAGGVLYLWAQSRGAGKPTRREWRDAAIIGGLLFLIGHGTLAWAQQYVASGLAALLIATEPFWIVILDWARRNGVHPNLRVMFGLMLGFIGMGLLVGPADILGKMDLEAFPGLIVVGGAFSWALGTVYSRHAYRPAWIHVATGSQLLCGGLLLLLAGLVAGEWGSLDSSRVSLVAVLSLGYLIVFGSLVAFTGYNWLLGVTSLARISTYAYVNPVVAVFLGWALADEPIAIRTVVAAAVIVTAIAMILTGRTMQVSGQAKL